MDAITSKKLSKFQNTYQGQGMVEFALAIPIVLLLMLGIIEGGRLLFIYSSVVAASREAARYGSGAGSNGSGSDLYRDCAGIQEAAKRVGTFAGVEDSNVSIQYDKGPGEAITYSNCSNSVHVKLGDRIIVTVSVPYSPIVPLVPFPSINVTSTNAHTIISNVPVKGTPGTLSAPYSTNTPLPSRTPTASNTPPPGATLTFTPTPTRTPISSSTPTLTPTPTPGGPCNTAAFDISVSNPQGQVVIARITNNKKASKISSVSITWKDEKDTELKQVTINPGSTIWSGSDPTSGFSMTGNWDLPMGVTNVTFSFNALLKKDAEVKIGIDDGFCYLTR